MQPEAAAELARDALLWLAAREEDMGTFLAAGGLAPAEVRRRAGDPEFLGFVLDFLLADEALLLAFAAEAGVKPDRPLRARMALPGGATPEWT